MEYELHKALLDNRDSKIAELETALKAAEEKAKDAEERMAQSVDWICLRIFCDHSQNVHCDKHLTEFCTETACPLIPKEV